MMSSTDFEILAGGETGDSIPRPPPSNVPTATGGSAVAAATTRNVNLECVHRSVLNVKSESEADPCETLSMPEADTHCEVKWVAVQSAAVAGPFRSRGVGFSFWKQILLQQIYYNDCIILELFHF